MKKILFVLLFLLPFAAQAQLTTCTVTATIYDWQGQPADSVEVKVTKVLNQAGKLIVARPYSYFTDTNGVAEIIVPRSTATDTVTAYIFIDLWNSPFASKGRLGVGVAIPNAATANLEDLDPVNVIPLTHVVAVPTLTIADSSGGAYTTDSLRLGAGLRAIAPTNGGGTPTIIATATGTGDVTTAQLSDSLDTVVRAESDPLSVHLADTNALHAQKFKNINDTLTAHKTGLDAKQNVLPADFIARGDTTIIPGVKISFSVENKNLTISVDTAGFFALYGGVMAELDPTAIAKASSVVDSTLTDGTRSVNTTGRYWADSDSLTFAGEAGDVIDCSQGVVFVGTLAANDTLSFSNIPPAGKTQTVQVVVTQGGTATLSWTGVRWVGAAAPALNTTANKGTVFTFLIVGGIVRGISASDV